MENATFSIEHSTNFRFFSVCQYITSFGIFFYNQSLIPLEYRNHSVSVLNTLFDYLHNAENESLSKLELLQRVLAGSDLYGGGENETLDMKYVNESYHYIISSALFFDDKYINGYLAQMFSTADNLTYIAFKNFVYQHFSEQFLPKDFCSSRKEKINLTSLIIKKVFNENIWSMFPEPEGNPEIMDINYIYAIIGLKIARSVQADPVNLSFESYYHLGQEIKFGKFEMEIFQDVLELFKTPALFYYASKQKDQFRKDFKASTSRGDQSLSKAYKMFFIFFYLDYGYDYDQVNIEFLTGLELMSDIFQIKERTLIATELLKDVCEYSSNHEVPSVFVSIYKTSQWLLKYILPKRCQKIDLPNLETIFNSQFDNIKKLSNELLKMNLRKVFKNEKLIVDKINLNSTVKFANAVPKWTNCSSCVPIENKINEDILIIFAVIMNNQTDFYALNMIDGSILLLNRENKEKFSREIANDTFSEIKLQTFGEFLKKHDEDFNVFIQRLANVATEHKINKFMSVARNPTMIEEKVEFLKSLLPLYTCMESKKSGNKGRILLSCGLDALSLLRIKVKDKYLNITWNSLIAYAVKQISSVFKKLESLNRNEKNNTFTIKGSKISEKEKKFALTRNFALPLLKELLLHPPQVLIFGSELSFDVFGSTNRQLRKMILDPSTDLRNLSEFKNFLSLVEFGSSIIINNTKLLPDNTGLIPKVLENGKNYKIVRYFYPGGSHHFGPKCILSYGKFAEIRRTNSRAKPIAFVQIKSKGRLRLYSAYNWTSGTIGDSKFRLNRKGYLKLIL
ncbi:uncharacterized protein LOC122506628 [Leptopilina heterotoma]|uniref:uncharacterized protein LOC122506628 n=1 Tax=Leptopilina heterotoma TaxID=63436 RepID=UPI001CA8CC75|nr:uncharacterized protein LOC122506628 [Leptopilina heterotoma]XP_043474866.1 uncharacterized protein LOC122506628 [Leptopilina heterotoma]